MDKICNDENKKMSNVSIVYFSVPDVRFSWGKSDIIPHYGSQKHKTGEEALIFVKCNKEGNKTAQSEINLRKGNNSS